MRKFESKRNGQVAELVSENEKQIVIKLETGEEKTLSLATLKRWWKALPEEEAQSEETTVEIIDTRGEEDVTKNTESMPDEIVNTASKVTEPASNGSKDTTIIMTKKEKTPKADHKSAAGAQQLKDFVETLATNWGTAVFETSVPSFKSLKVDGKMYAAFIFNKKGITLWLRSKAIDFTEFKKMNHMFDARVHFSEYNEEAKKLITELLEASLKFQKNKKAKK